MSAFLTGRLGRCLRTGGVVALVAATGVGLSPVVRAANAAPAPRTLSSTIVRNPAHAGSVHVASVKPAKAARPFLSVHPAAVVGIAKTFTVNETTDSVAAHPGNGVCADAAGKCSLRTAIQQANALNRPVVINVPKGTYKLTIAPNNATTPADDITSGDLNVTDHGGIVINATGATINASALGDRIFEVDNGASLVLNGGTLTGGNAADGSSHSGTTGGALALPDPTSTAVLQGVTITGNKATGDGGGVAILRGELWLTDSSVSHNSANGSDGGGVYNQDGAAQLVGDTLSGNTVNSAGTLSSAEGGALYNNDGPVSIRNATISGNTVLVGTDGTGEGGGVFADDETIIANATITGNSVKPASGATLVTARGGGIGADYGLESVTNSVIDHNTVIPQGTSNGEGGGIYDDNGTVLTNSRVTNNSIIPGAGSTNLAAFGGGISIEDGTEQIANTLVDHNSATSSGTGRGEGGGIYNGLNVTVTNSTISNNIAGIQNQSGNGGGSGGGLSEEGDNALIVNSKITGNQALGGLNGSFAGSAGGIMADDITAVSNSLIANNHAAQNGGGFWSDDGQHLNADTFSGNTASAGGAIFNEWQTEVVNSTISGNSTSGTNNNGGGVFNSAINGFSKVLLFSSTVAANKASSGSGLSNGLGSSPLIPGGYVLNDTIVGDNTGSSQCNLTLGVLTSIGHNLSSDGSCGLVAPGDITGVNPGLNPLRNNGGPTPTMSLQKTSAAIDAGDCPAVDQRGFPRPPVRCDIGAYEQAGYRFAATDGGVFTFGDAAFWGSTGGVALTKPIVTIANTPTGHGYWLAASDGGIFTFGDAKFFGSTGNVALVKPIVGMAATPDGKGYWLVASDGGIFSFGDAKFFGSTGNVALVKPIVGMAATPDGKGYWLVASDGGIFSFGDAHFFGSTGNVKLAKPIVGMAATPDGKGYWFVATDGGVFSFGDAHFFGSTGNVKLAKPIVAMAPTPDGNGYILIASDGGVFTFGNAHFFGSTGNVALTKPIVDGTGV